MDFKIGVMVDSFKLDIKEGIKKAAEVGAEGIQVYAVSGEMDPDNFPRMARKGMLDFIKSNGLVVSAVCGDLGGHGFAKKEDNAWKIEKSKKIMELAKDLESDIVTTHIGVVPEVGNECYEIMAEACNELAEFACSIGSTFAVETGPEKAVTLRKFLNSLNTNGVGVNFDPANMVMVTGDDPVEGVFELRDYIVHTHAKDGRMIKSTDPEKIYSAFAEPDLYKLNFDDYFIETPLGDGSVNFSEYLKALKSIGYRGFLTIEREVGKDPVGDIEKAVRFLKKSIL